MRLGNFTRKMGGLWERIDAFQRRISELPAPAPPRQGLETILLVEDDVEVRTAVGMVLRRCGYAILSAQHGAEALRISQQYEGPIQLLLTDVVMPQMRGSELAQVLAVMRPDTKVLYMSGYPDDPLIDAGVPDPSPAFLRKPFTAERLALKVREVLEGDLRESLSRPSP